VLIAWINPKISQCFVNNWFLKAEFEVTGMNILWYFKMVEDILLSGAVLFAGALQASTRNYKTYLEWQRYSFRLYVIWCLYFLYHLFDMTMFFYDFKTSHVAYITALTLVSSLALFAGFYKIKQDK
jgi:hypothetical protein